MSTSSQDNSDAAKWLFSKPLIDRLKSLDLGLLTSQDDAQQREPDEAPNAAPDARTNEQTAQASLPVLVPEPPSQRPTACPIGTNVTGEVVSLADSVRSQGTLILGRTGSGKTTLLEHLIRQDIATRTACVVLDPQGPMTKRLLSTVTPEQAERVYVLEADIDHPFGINLYQIDETGVGQRSSSHELVVDKYVALLISLFRKVFGVDRWVTIEFALRHTARTLLATPGTSMADVPRLLRDEVFRQRCLQNVYNERTLEFWRMWEESLGRNQQLLLSLITKFADFLDTGFISRVVSQPKTTIPFRELFHEGATLLISLPKGEHEEQTKILGALLLTEIARVIYERVHEPQAPSVHLYIDEYPRFGAEFTRELLTGGRQFGCGTTVAFQHLTQLEDRQDQDALLQMGSKAIFGVVDTDAHTLARNLPRMQKVEKQVSEYQSEYWRNCDYLLAGQWGEKVTETIRYLLWDKRENTLISEETREYCALEHVSPGELVFIIEHFLRPLARRAQQQKEQGIRWFDNEAQHAFYGINGLIRCAERACLYDAPVDACPSGIRTQREELLCCKILPDLYMDELPQGQCQLAQELAQSRAWTPLLNYLRSDVLREFSAHNERQVRKIRDDTFCWADRRTRNAPIIPYVLRSIARFDQLSEAERRLGLQTRLPADWFDRQVRIWLRLAEIIQQSPKLVHTKRTITYTEYPPLERSAQAELLASLPPHHALVHAPDFTQAEEVAILPPLGPQAPSPRAEPQAVIASIRARSRERLCGREQLGRMPATPSGFPTKRGVRRSHPVSEDAASVGD